MLLNLCIYTCQDLVFLHREIKRDGLWFVKDANVRPDSS